MRVLFRLAIFLSVAVASALLGFATGPSVAAVVNGASYAGAVAPGSIAAVFGTFPVTSILTASGATLPPNIGGVSFSSSSGKSFPLFYVAASQAGVQVPWELTNSTDSTIMASAGGQAGSPQPLKLAPFAPGIFSTNAQGTGQGAILDASYRLVDASNPASAGTVLQIYCTGLGAVTNQPASGTPSPSDPLAMTTTTPTVTIGGLAAQVLFSGLAPGFVGLYQVNAQLPNGVAGGNAVPVVISIGGAISNAVTIAMTANPVTISPTSAMVLPGSVQSFSGTVANIPGGGVLSWSVQEGAAGGTIGSDGTYTAPTKTGTYHIIATNAQNSSQTASATVTVLPASSYTILNPSAGAAGSVGNPAATLVESKFFPNHFLVGGLTGVFDMDPLGNVASLGRQYAASEQFPPVSSLVQATDGIFYATAAAGGPLGLGSIFTVIFTSDPSGNVIAAYGVPLYSWRGVVFNGDQGASPQAPLIQAADGNLYGTTYSGGNAPTCTYRSGCGTVFRITLSGTLTVLHSFSGPDGAQPAAGLIQAKDGFFYGTTSAGGSLGLGTVYKMDGSGTVTVLRSLSAADGTVPLAGLIQGTDGNFYGTASAGGSSACTAPVLNNGCGGTVFRVSPAGDFAVLHAFSGADGNEPVAPLTQTSDGYLYGTTWGGGNLTCGPTFSVQNYPYFRQAGCGTVFRVDPSGNFAVIHAFASLDFGMPLYDGAGPVGGVMQGNDGNLYGTTFYGGTGVTFGSVFRMTLPPR